MNISMKKNKKGFTLLEIIIVVIIVGVLASLALPRLFSTVEYSRSTEAFAAVGSIRAAMERCLLKKGGTGNYADCDSLTTNTDLDISDPNNEAGAHFSYTVTGTTDTGYTITATRTTLDSGVATSIISLTVNRTAKSITKAGATAFSKL